MHSLPRSFAHLAALLHSCLLLGLLAVTARGATLLPYPLGANQRGTVACLEHPTISYDIYLPPRYSPTGTPLPILYTFAAGGGGLVSKFQAVCQKSNIICVGIVGSKNYAPKEILLREVTAVSRDIRLRVLFDPTAEFGAGFSGGGTCAYIYSRIRSQHVSGVMDMAGWLGRGAGYPTYQTTDRLQTNFLIARTMGLSDARDYIWAPDSNYLSAFKVLYHDEYFTGAHQVPPEPVQASCLSWLISNRKPAGPTDRADAAAQATNWRTRLAPGKKEQVLRECVAALLEHPRTWLALEAQLILDNLLRDHATFPLLSMEGLAQGDYAQDLFFYTAQGSGDASDWLRYRSALQALTGITGHCNDQAGNIRALLLSYGYAAPALTAVQEEPDRVTVRCKKTTFGLKYILEARGVETNALWSEVTVPADDTNTCWSTTFDLPPDPAAALFRVRTAPAEATSPPWPGEL